MPLVSVIVPTFNRAYCLARTLDSALAQTHREIEVLVVDDGSTDDTRAMIDARYPDDNRVRYFHQANGGVANARNTAIAAAKGEYIAFLDSDDVWQPWKIELQVSCMQSFPDLVMVWTDMEAMDPSGCVFDRAYIRTMYSAYQSFAEAELFPQRRFLKEIVPSLHAVVRDASLLIGNIFSQMIMGSLVHTSTVLLRRDCVARLGGFDERLRYAGEDYDFHLRTCREGPVGFIDLASIQYQRGMPDRLTRDEYRIHIALNFLTTVKPYIDHAREEISLPQHMIDSMLADTYLWIGGIYVDMGNGADGRKNLLMSLRRQAFQPYAWLLYLACFLPHGILAWLRRYYRMIKMRMRGQAASS
jgi:GT2 family glycosyltransferase